MTDRENAELLGNYINGLLVEVEILKGVMKLRDENPEATQGIPVEEIRRQVSEDETFRRTIASHTSTLLHVLGHETEASVLIQALCRNYFPE
jgi:hypothetical protein